MLTRLRQLMLGELQVPNTSPHALAELRSRAGNIHQLSGDSGLNAFVGRLTPYTAVKQTWRDRSLASNKPPRDWVDADLDQAAIEITDLSQRFIRAETFAGSKAARQAAGPRRDRRP